MPYPYSLSKLTDHLTLEMTLPLPILLRWYLSKRCMPRLLCMLNRFLFANKSLSTLLTDNVECRGIDIVSPRLQLLRHGLCRGEDLFVGWIPWWRDLVDGDVCLRHGGDKCVGESIIVDARVYQNTAGGIGFACVWD